MAAVDIRLSVNIPEWLSVVAFEFEVYSIGPRRGIVWVSGFENNLLGLG